MAQNRQSSLLGDRDENPLPIGRSSHAAPVSRSGSAPPSTTPCDLPMPSAVIIGAGVGGLALAARLQAAGVDVTVVEKNESSGGRCSLLRRNGWRFDRGPSFYLMPEVFAQTFAELGERVDAWYRLQKCPNSYKALPRGPFTHR
ncbi:Phytoene desaturase [Neolecta irregularis DAH-3]|uniref:Phytoene desaturase n=1 Tax=Neolecta irregularis (strain DAH-3) TaxID=1198029 RepID=A0A1U7LHK3_NEOID|nr:Phytoene desaturase [Neolecta irregularis DAH-3]|eukprot:OLL22073.1 Phytoene desaturase [Neolecta irregularis DAH-3]